MKLQRRSDGNSRPDGKSRLCDGSEPTRGPAPSNAFGGTATAWSLQRERRQAQCSVLTPHRETEAPTLRAGAGDETCRLEGALCVLARAQERRASAGAQ